jgi:hypothetical protein
MVAFPPSIMCCPSVSRASFEQAVTSSRECPLYAISYVLPFQRT